MKVFMMMMVMILGVAQANADENTVVGSPSSFMAGEETGWGGRNYDKSLGESTGLNSIVFGEETVGGGGGKAKIAPDNIVPEPIIIRVDNNDMIKLSEEPEEVSVERQQFTCTTYRTETTSLTDPERYSLPERELGERSWNTETTGTKTTRRLGNTAYSIIHTKSRSLLSGKEWSDRTIIMTVKKVISDTEWIENSVRELTINDPSDKQPITTRTAVFETHYALIDGQKVVTKDVANGKELKIVETTNITIKNDDGSEVVSWQEKTPYSEIFGITEVTTTLVKGSCHYTPLAD
jgi:hypothetical protein